MQAQNSFRKSAGERMGMPWGVYFLNLAKANCDGEEKAMGGLKFLTQQVEIKKMDTFFCFPKKEGQ